jgi:hypothetical protein
MYNTWAYSASFLTGCQQISQKKMGWVSRVGLQGSGKIYECGANKADFLIILQVNTKLDFTQLKEGTLCEIHFCVS